MIKSAVSDGGLMDASVVPSGGFLRFRLFAGFTLIPRPFPADVGLMPKVARNCFSELSGRPEGQRNSATPKTGLDVLARFGELV